MKPRSLTRSQSHNIFCPTGEGGGIDPSCHYHEGFERARERASSLSTQAHRASHTVSALDSMSRAAKLQASRAAAMSDRAAESPGHEAQRLHGMASDEHYEAAGRHRRAVDILLGYRRSRETVGAHRTAARLHEEAGRAHEYVSGRREEAHRLSQEAHNLTQGLNQNEPYAHDATVDSGDAADLARQRRHVSAARAHMAARQRLSYSNARGAVRARRAHEKAAEAHFRLHED